MNKGAGGVAPDVDTFVPQGKEKPEEGVCLFKDSLNCKAHCSKPRRMLQAPRRLGTQAASVLGPGCTQCDGDMGRATLSCQLSNEPAVAWQLQVPQDGLLDRPLPVPIPTMTEPVYPGLNPHQNFSLLFLWLSSDPTWGSL